MYGWLIIEERSLLSPVHLSEPMLYPHLISFTDPRLHGFYNSYKSPPITMPKSRLSEKKKKNFYIDRRLASLRGAHGPAVTACCYESPVHLCMISFVVAFSVTAVIARSLASFLVLL